MLETLPAYLSISFIIVTLFCLLLVTLTVYSSEELAVRRKATGLAVILLAWILLQSILALSGIFHSDPEAIPPTIILLGVLPALLTIIVLMLTRKGQRFIDSLPLPMLTYIHTVRIPVELVLYGLYLNGAVPELMTFEGRNFDIFAGITAPMFAYFGITRKKLSRKMLLIWNFICLGLLLNIVVHAVLSAPSPFQQLAFEQPNVAILYFPFSLLPAFVVPVVLFAHLASIFKLFKAPRHPNL